MENQNLKIAFVSGNAKSINGSFGSTKYFEVFSIENGQIAKRETRETFVDQADADVPNIIQKIDNGSGSNGFAKSFSLTVVDKSKEKHMKIAKSISDCNYVVARGMCANAYDSVQQFKMNPILTDIKEFEEGIKQILEGTIINHTDKIH